MPDASAILMEDSEGQIVEDSVVKEEKEEQKRL
jgi:hypothetical protein